MPRRRTTHTVFATDPHFQADTWDTPALRNPLVQNVLGYKAHEELQQLPRQIVRKRVPFCEGRLTIRISVSGELRVMQRLSRQRVETIAGAMTQDRADLSVAIAFTAQALDSLISLF